MIPRSAAIAAIALSQMIVAGPLAAESREGKLQIAQAIIGELPPYEMAAIVRSMGLRPITQPVRQGPTYVLRAIDRRGEERRVVLDARYGDVIESVPVVRAPGYPGARVVRLPDRGFDDDDDNDLTPPSPYPPRVIPAPRAAAPAPRAAAVTPPQPAQAPVPRPRPDLSQTASVPSAPPAAKPVEQKPAEAKPAEAKPVETKPAEAKPKIFVPDVAPLD